MDDARSPSARVGHLRAVRGDRRRHVIRSVDGGVARQLAQSAAVGMDGEDAGRRVGRRQLFAAEDDLPVRRGGKPRQEIEPGSADIEGREPLPSTFATLMSLGPRDRSGQEGDLPAVGRPIEPVEARQRWGQLADRGPIGVGDREDQTRRRRRGSPDPRRNSSLVPSREKPGPKSIVVPADEQALGMGHGIERRRCRRRALETIGPLRAGPNGCGRRRRDPTQSGQRRSGDEQAATTSSQASLGSGARRSVVSTGSHLSRLDHAGRCRVRVSPQDGIEVLRHPVLGVRVEPVGDGRGRSRRRGFMPGVLPESGPGRASASSAARISRSPR